MGNFEKQIPDYIRLVAKEISEIERERLDLLHDCDCEYCDIQGEVPHEEERYYEHLGDKIQERRKLIDRLERHAQLHGIKLEEKEKVKA